MTDQPKVEYRKRVGAGVVYSDYLHISWNYAGFKINFAAYVPFSEPDDGSLAVEEVAAVGLSAEHAQQLHRILGEQLKDYAKRFGEIRSEPKPPQKKDPE